jgi:hypothetical protein
VKESTVRIGRCVFLAVAWLALAVACVPDDADDDAETTGDVPGVLYAGAAEGNLDVSVGTSMAGYTGRLQDVAALRLFSGGLIIVPPDDRVSPFADLGYPSIGVHTMPTAKAVTLVVKGNPESYLIFCRLEIANTTDVLRRRIERLVSARLGFDVTDRLIVSATHTHGGPGRIWPLPYFGDFGFDTYDPTITERLAASAADVIVRSARSVRPAKIGMNVFHGLDPEDLIYRDRRASSDDGDLLTNDDPFTVDADGQLVPDGKPDGPRKDDRLTLVRVEGTDGIPIAVLFSFPCHGTVLDVGNFYLSGDVLGVTERKLSEAIGRPAPVTMFFQAAHGDVEPIATWQQYQKVEESAEILATRIKGAYDATPLSPLLSGIDVAGATVRYDRDLLGYGRAPYPFSQFEAPYGGGMCGILFPTFPFHCISRPRLQVPDVWYAGIATGAVAAYFCGKYGLCEDDLLAEFVRETNPTGQRADYPPELFYARYQSTRLRGITRRVMTREAVVDDAVTDVFLLPVPGEALTSFGYQFRGTLMNAARDLGAVVRTPDDLVLVGIAQDSFGYVMPAKEWLYGGYEISINTWGPLWGDYVQRNLVGLALELIDGVPRVERWPIVERPDPVLFQPRPVASPTTGALDPPKDGDRFGAYAFRWQGGDPGVDHPLVTLQREGEDGLFADVVTADGNPVTSDSYELMLFYADDNVWQVFWELAEDDPTGTFRFAVHGTNYDGGDQRLAPPFFSGTPYDIASEPFTVTAGALRVGIHDTRTTRLLLDVLYPENRPDFDGNTPDHFRFRPERPPTVSCRVTYTDWNDPTVVYTQEVELDQPAPEPVWVVLNRAVPGGRYIIDVEAVDAFGNAGSQRVVRDVL